MVQARLVLENERIKVTEVRIAPGEILPMHTHGAYVSYTMNSSKVRVAFPDGSTKEREFQKGAASYSDPGVTHSIENIGSTDVFNLDVEFKDFKKS